MYAEVIASQRCDVFLRHSVYLLVQKCHRSVCFGSR